MLTLMNAPRLSPAVKPALTLTVLTSVCVWMVTKPQNTALTAASLSLVIRSIVRSCGYAVKVCLPFLFVDFYLFEMESLSHKKINKKECT